MKNTKIICTIGPETEDVNILKEMIMAGMDVARINLSHSDHDFAQKVIENIRKLNKELGTSVGILMDIKGPKIRISHCHNEYVYLKAGTEIILTTKYTKNKDKFLINYPEVINDVKTGDKILLDDGLVELLVLDKKTEDVVCEILNEGYIRNNTSVNVPGVDLSIDFLSASDKNDILFASLMDADYISLSFVRNANDVLDVNDMLIGLRNEHVQIIAKIENNSAIKDIDNIIKVSDGIMVARGDLGVEIALEKVPSVQKKIVKKCFDANKICIVATQMLSSMQEKPTPTRAEVSDVANAVIDGADAVMLSGETAIGNYPVKTIETMAKIIVNIEENLDYENILNSKKGEGKQDITSVIAHNVVDSANRIKTAAIIVSTISGYTAQKVSSYRPSCPILTITPDEAVARSLSLNWGIIPIVSPMFNSTDEIVENAIKTFKEKIAERNTNIIITGGLPMNEESNTNFMKIEEIKE